MKSETKQQYIRLIRTYSNMSITAFKAGDTLRATELLDEAVNIFNAFKTALKAHEQDNTKTYVNYGVLKLAA
jgi:predicted translin family RNA/ssDNA-binding protein